MITDGAAGAVYGVVVVEGLASILTVSSADAKTNST